MDSGSEGDSDEEETVDLARKLTKIANYQTKRRCEKDFFPLNKKKAPKKSNLDSPSCLNSWSWALKCGPLTKSHGSFSCDILLKMDLQILNKYLST